MMRSAMSSSVLLRIARAAQERSSRSVSPSAHHLDASVCAPLPGHPVTPVHGGDGLAAHDCRDDGAVAQHGSAGLRVGNDDTAGAFAGR